MGGKNVCVAVAVGLLISSAHAGDVASQAPTAVANAKLVSATISVTVSDVLLKEVLQEISKQARLVAVYSDAVAKSDRRISLSVHNVPVEIAFDRVLAGTGLKATIMMGNVIFERMESTSVAQGSIAGKVMHAKTKQPIVGATVTVAGESASVVTGEDGRFVMPVADGAYRLTVRAVGFMRQVQAVTVADGQTATVEVVLEPSASVLDEVVVTGTIVATERRAIATPITVITAEDIERRGITRIEQLLRGEVPGVYASDMGIANYGMELPGQMQSTEVYVRGGANLESAGSGIKTFVDGVELVDPSLLGTIDPASIERIEIITGPQAATVYGSGALGGVMQVFTKRGSILQTPELSLNLQYGTLQSNFSSGLSPSHRHSLQVNGSAGSVLTYSANASYSYVGQWQPGLFSRQISMSVGGAITQGNVRVEGTYTNSNGQNGASNASAVILNPVFRALAEEGMYQVRNMARSFQQRENRGLSQTFSIVLDLKTGSALRHQATIGRNQNDLALVPMTPVHSDVADTMYQHRASINNGINGSYNVTLMLDPAPSLSSTLTVGFSGTSERERVNRGCSAEKDGQSWGSCRGGAGTANLQVYSASTRSAGGFISWRLGLWQQLFATFGVRGEQNPLYGRDHKIDWTPTNGISYSRDIGDVTVKLFGSYGRSTRPPGPSQRDSLEVNPASGIFYEPSQFLTRLANPNLTPEYARGPQGGFEIYWGARGSVMVNHYRQYIADQIVLVDRVDSVYLFFKPVNEYRYLPLSQYLNAASIKQQGWELTGSFRFSAFDVKGTYTWMKSVIASVPDRIGGSPAIQMVRPGDSNLLVPSHTGNLRLGYALGRTSANFYIDWRGKSLYNTILENRLTGLEMSYVRIPAYHVRGRNSGSSRVDRSGYAKMHLTANHRINTNISLLVNIQNLGNNFASDSFRLTDPSLGRQTLMGISMRFPQR